MFLSQVNMKNSPKEWFASVLFTKRDVKLSTKKLHRCSDIKKESFKNRLKYGKDMELSDKEFLDYQKINK